MDEKELELIEQETEETVGAEEMDFGAEFDVMDAEFEVVEEPEGTDAETDEDVSSDTSDVPDPEYVEEFEAEEPESIDEPEPVEEPEFEVIGSETEPEPEETAEPEATAEHEAAGEQLGAAEASDDAGAEAAGAEGSGAEDADAEETAEDEAGEEKGDLAFLFEDEEKPADDEAIDEMMAERDEPTVSTTNFYEQYGGEIQAYLSKHESEDPIEVYEVFEEEHTDETVPPKPKKKRKKKHYFLKFMIVLAAIIALIAFLMSSYFDIQEIKVEGTDKLKKSQVIEMSGVKEGTNIFKLHKKDAQGRLLESPYISHAEIKRDLPGTVSITILERNESAAVKYGKEYLVIDPKGYVLRTTKKLPKLTLLSDMKIKEINVGKKLEVMDEGKFSQGLELIKVMKTTDVYFKKIEFGKKKVRAYVYDRLVCVGLFDDVKGSLEDGSLEQVVRDLYGKKIKKGTVIIDGGRFISYSPKFNK